MALTETGDGNWKDDSGNVYASKRQAADMQRNEFGDAMIGGIRAVGNWFEKKAAERAKEEQDEAKRRATIEAIQQVFAAYKAGKINEAIDSCISYGSQLEAEYYMHPIAAVILYQHGNYQQAANCDGDGLLGALCYEKMGDKKTATDILLFKLDLMCNSILGYGHNDVAQERSLLSNVSYYKNKPLDFNYSEVVPLITARAEEGNKDFFKFMGDMYCFGVGMKNNDYANAQKWYEKAIANNDANALFTVGMCYKDGGCGYQQDKNKGMSYLQKAARQGHAEAKDAIKRGGFVSVLFGIVGALGTSAFAYFILQKAGLLAAIGVIAGLIAGFIITMKAWQTRKNILLLIMLGISVIGFVSFIGSSKTSSSSQQTATVTEDAE